MAVKIMKCSCISEFQDKEYGKGNRVFNSCGDDATRFRCATCGKEIKLGK